MKYRPAISRYSALQSLVRGGDCTTGFMQVPRDKPTHVSNVVETLVSELLIVHTHDRSHGKS